MRYFITLILFMSGVALSQSWETYDLKSNQFMAVQNLDSASHYKILAFESAKSKFGLKDTICAQMADDLVEISYYRGDIETSLKYGRISKSINEEIHGSESTLYALSCANLGLVMQANNWIDSAIVYTHISKNIIEINGDTLDAEYANTLLNLAGLHREKAELDSALVYMLKGKTIMTAVVPSEHNYYGRALNDLATLFSDLHRYEEAIVLLEGVRDIALRTTKREHRDYLLACRNLGSIYTNNQEFDKALPYFLEAKELISKLIGKKNPTYASTVEGLAILYGKLSNYEKARDLNIEALNIIEELYGKGHTKYAATGSALGVVYGHLGQYDSALYYYHVADTIYLKTYGDKHFLYAANLNKISGVLMEKKEFDKAYPYSLEAAKIMENSASQNFVAYLTMMANLGHFYMQVDSAEAALDVYRKIENEYDQTFRADDPRYSIFCNNYSNLLNGTGHTDEALKYRMTSLDIMRSNQFKNFSFSSEEEKEKYVVRTKTRFNDFFSMAVDNPDETAMIEMGYDYLLFNKGVLLKSTQIMINSVLKSEDSLLITKYYEWISYKRRIASAFAKGADVSALQFRANELESELVNGSKEFSDINNVKELNWKNVQDNIQDGEWVIEFVRYRDRGKEIKSEVFPYAYAALIINKTCKSPTIVELFKESELEEIIGTFPGNNLSYIEQVYGSKENTKSQLYDLIWKPLEEELNGAKKVFLSPDGLLHKISFAALAKDQDVFLCDNYEIEMMSSTGKLALQSEARSQKSDVSSVSGLPASSQVTTLFGGINYNSDSTTTEHWKYLDGSLSETQQIEKILKKGKVNYNYYNQSTATEAQFKDIASKSSILHIATHGFFYPDPDLALEDFVDEEETEEPINFRGGRTGVGVNTFVKSRNPLMRSGLAFAGANDVWNRTSIDGEDGVLTAAEVATIDMRNTELVVLSACETGLGDIKGSEGVYGLQRSFKMAGVKYLIMSLWQVPDKETAEFMTSFYKNLTKTNDIKKSFSMTQAEMRNKYDPYYWAAFVLVE